LYREDTITLLSSWNVDKAVELIERSKSSHFAGVAPMLIDLERFEGLEDRDIGSLRGIVYAGAPCPIDILQTLNRRIGCKIYSNYGYSEEPVTHFTRFGKAAEWIETKIIDDSGKELLAPCEGEILARGANFIPGYYG
jgi:acyl-CoA synthetase (AMP-forming)/AMP-acid ligase II